MLLHKSRAVVKRAFHSTVTSRATEASTTAFTTQKITLNLSTPYQCFFKETQVDLIQIPGAVGEYGVTAGHTPIISQMKPGVIKVHVEREKDVQTFFTAGGFAFTHADSVTDIACVELIKLEDIDRDAAEAGLNNYKSIVATAADGSAEKIEAQIGLETHQALASALAAIN
uniref:ATP synthase subunit delta' putative n=1 Tax=Albugo laibachii Nc14 TaxID=890382 RepID=F0WZW2_9STRA|nr:ATP synthase subunit delta' putative [Albugo laibachii Nc14]|eukprot:CCA27041.1 ATP synthase subunit delta' putative [Albugo laibachii Nc14]